MNKAQKMNQRGRPSPRFPRPPGSGKRTSTASRFPVIGWVLILGLAGCFGVMIYWSQRPAAPLAPGRAAETSPLSAHASTSLASTNQSGGSQNEKTKEQEASGLNLLGNNLLKAGDLPGAIRAYQQALALTPADEDMHFNLGIAYAQADDFTNAESQYKEALRLLPEYPEVHNNLGNLLLREGRLAEAETELNEAIKDMPDYSQAHNNLGILLQKQGRAEDAISSFRKAAETDTNYWQAHFNLANAYLLLTNKEAAAGELKQTLRLNPGFEPALKAAARLERATNQGPR